MNSFCCLDILKNTNNEEKNTNNEVETTNNKEETNEEEIIANLESLCESKHIKELQENGYTIIHNVFNDEEISEYINEFNSWLKSINDLEYLHNLIHSHGIFKYFQVGHQRFAWLARTNPKIVNIFKKLWNTNDLVTSFDGCCFYPTYYNKEDVCWIHSDQSSREKGLHCYQSFLSLTSNKERTLMLYKKSHLLHEDYFKTMNIDEPSDWSIIDIYYLNNMSNDLIKIETQPGDLVIWDSRTFHQNSCGNYSCNEERLVQYLCYLPRFHINNDDHQNELRKKYFEKLRTTSHWPYPMNAVPKQPSIYNYYNPYNVINIDYNNLAKPKLDDLLDKINSLI